MKMEHINVVIKRPREPFVRATIPNTLSDLQELVGGFIETVTFATDAVLICNEEGLISDLPYNCTMFGHQLFGTIAILGVNGDEFCDLSEEGIALFIGEVNADD